jgi:hypothetical protein
METPWAAKAAKVQEVKELIEVLGKRRGHDNTTSRSL